jgi:hypothetical protein
MRQNRQGTSTGKRRWLLPASLLWIFQLLSRAPLVTAVPSLCSDGLTQGYSTWEDLQNAIDSDPYSGAVLTICPNSVLQTPAVYLARGLSILGSIKIQCGTDGLRTCTILGPGRYLQFGEIGRDPFWSTNINFEMSGVTMKGGDATDYTSVWIDDSVNGNFTFTDCAWEVRFKVYC